MDRLSIFCREQALSSIDRVIGLMDRNPFSPTYGCLDKNFHYLRKSDFPNSAAQMSAFSLALLGKEQGSDLLLTWSRAAFEYTWSLQKKDGSFDEWYPNERGWAGPTGYILHTQIETYKLLLTELSSEVQEKSLLGIKRAAQALMRVPEVGDLANHYAIALLPLYQAARLLDDGSLLRGYEKLFAKFLHLVNEREGWSQEYDGVDISYNLATLSFLGRLHRENGDARILEYAQKSFSFLKYFFYPDGSFSGSVSTRHTQHFYPYAIRYWSSHLTEAATILEAIEKQDWHPQTVVPSDQDDHYVHYLMWDFLEASRTMKSMAAPDKLPCRGSDFEHYFQDAGLFVKKSQALYVVSNMKRGGAVVVFNCETSQKIAEDCGYVICFKKESPLTNLFADPNAKVDYKSHQELAVTARFGPVFHKTFTVFRFLLFRSFMSLMVNHRLAHIAKGLIRRVLIFQKLSETVTLNRSFDFSQPGRITIKDVVTMDKKWQSKIEKSFSGGHFYSRFVPQSRYFKSALHHYVPTENAQMLQALRQTGSFHRTVQVP